jgi:hypothetical protein
MTSQNYEYIEFLATDLEVPGSIPGTTKKVVGLERGPLSLVSTTEELLGRNSVSGLERREYGRRDFFYYYYSYIVWRRAREPILPVTGYSY